MSTLHDLRETLERRAEGLDDTGRQDRALAVRRRVRVARRRRTAVAVAAAVVLVGGVGAVATFQAPSKPEVAGPSVVGVDVPEEIAVHGFPYQLSEQHPIGGETVGIQLDGHEPQALSLVGKDLGSGSATLYVDGKAVSRVFADDPVAVPVPVRPSELQDPIVRVELHDAPADARTGVAIYDATGEPAPGVASADGQVVFRSAIAGKRLEAAAFSEPGETRVTVTADGTLDAAHTTWLCRTDEPGLWVRVTFDGELPSSSKCRPGSGSWPDAGDDPTSPSLMGSSPQTVEAVVTRGQHGPVVEGADVQLGIAVYDLGDTIPLGGTEVDTVIEHAGRTWRLDTEMSGGFGGVELTLASDTDLLVGFVDNGGSVRATWEGELASGRVNQAGIGGPGPGAFSGMLLLRGDTYDLELVDEGRFFGGVLLAYRPE